MGWLLESPQLKKPRERPGSRRGRSRPHAGAENAAPPPFPKPSPGPVAGPGRSGGRARTAPAPRRERLPHPGCSRARKTPRALIVGFRKYTTYLGTQRAASN